MGTCLYLAEAEIQEKQEDDIPLPLDKVEIDTFKKLGLLEESLLAYEDEQEPPVPHFFATYRKSV